MSSYLQRLYNRAAAPVALGSPALAGPARPSGSLTSPLAEADQRLHLPEFTTVLSFPGGDAIDAASDHQTTPPSRAARQAPQSLHRAESRQARTESVHSMRPNPTSEVEPASPAAPVEIVAGDPAPAADAMPQSPAETADQPVEFRVPDPFDIAPGDLAPRLPPDATAPASAALAEPDEDTLLNPEIVEPQPSRQPAEPLPPEKETNSNFAAESSAPELLSEPPIEIRERPTAREVDPVLEVDPGLESPPPEASLDRAPEPGRSERAYFTAEPEAAAEQPEQVIVERIVEREIVQPRAETTQPLAPRTAESASAIGPLPVRVRAPTLWGLRRR